MQVAAQAAARAAAARAGEAARAASWGGSAAAVRVGAASRDPAADAAQKGFFFYHGDGTNPNYDRALKQNGETTPNSSVGTVKVNSIQLTLNGQERHPGLDKGIPTDYLQSRLLPMLHSNSNSVQKQLKAMSSTAYTATQLGGGDVADSNAQLYELQGSKNIFVYPFSLNMMGKGHGILLRQ